MKSLISGFIPSKKVAKQMRYLIGLLALALFIMACMAIYSYFKVRNSQAGHKAFMESLAEYDKNISAPTNEQKWNDVIRAFDTAYQRYGNTPLGPSMLAYKAQALIYDNKFDAALDTMIKAVSIIKKSSPLYYIYLTKLSLMKIDSAEAKVKEAGKQELNMLADDIKNPERDWASYYVGYFASVEGEIEKARVIWSALIGRAAKDSAWAALAKQKLAFLENN